MSITQGESDLTSDPKVRNLTISSKKCIVFEIRGVHVTKKIYINIFSELMNLYATWCTLYLDRLL